MKKLLFIGFILMSFHLQAQVFNPANSTWYVQFSQDLKIATLTLTATGSINERTFSFGNLGGSMQETVLGSNYLGNWQYKMQSSVNGSFKLFKIGQPKFCWVFEFLQFKNNKYYYTISLSYNNKNDWMTLFTDPGLKNRYFQKNDVRNHQAGYVLNRSGFFGFSGNLGATAFSPIDLEGLYVLDGKDIYCLPLRIRVDPSPGYTAYTGSDIYDCSIIYDTPRLVIGDKAGYKYTER